MSTSPDPVAEKSGFLRMYMSSHPDTLVAYAKWYGKVTEPVLSAEMVGIDTKGMTLACKLKNGSSKDVRVAIEPPLSGYDDVKPRLLEMKAIAQEGLGMIKTPKITTFHFPRSALSVIFVVYPILLYLAYAPTFSTTSTTSSTSTSVITQAANMITLPARLLTHTPYLGPWVPSIGYWLFWSVNVGHVFEAMYTASLCRRHGTGLGVGAAYVLATLVCGYHIWRDLRKRIQDARIQSVMKIE
ncbi:hypothetical protein EV361DRAFT_919982 [Lentinula raphanica]|nr:hypothetical protein F5880DRAFT_1579149 [Lentinula raphanica]KAJ3969604.1 hypothetical protein EV361DRAFT_919982 [Lentinula raphanica]